MDKLASELKQQLTSLRPELLYAEHEVQEKMQLITAAKERWVYVRVSCGGPPVIVGLVSALKVHGGQQSLQACRGDH